MDAKYDIFKKLPDGPPLWIKAVEGLEQARGELAQIAKSIPGEYFLFDTRIGAVVSNGRPTTFSAPRQLAADSLG